MTEFNVKPASPQTTSAPIQVERRDLDRPARPAPKPVKKTKGGKKK